MKINQNLMDALKISDEELEELKEAFAIFDQDKSGFIEPQELRHILQVLGQNPTKAEIDSIIAEADVIVIDGKIDFNEFARIMKSNYKFKSASEMDNELMSAFQVFDRDSNGYISRQELEFVLTSIGERLTSEEVDEMFRFADTNEDGRISYKEFVVLFNHSFKGSFA
ncbi:hypothetical protein BOX15_Mlig001318g1 [Macrostomum lignano]|uniref:Uncharacterized protein n=2 Tax=Macrostomum lignano TaxID=282301 RepID=A0A267DI61_9PLAT|nr:hypothetical protein BOX15_Mlig001318g3 [Macrostomum lignano]PAA63618.1 hypothetical protein BOX15_Mlig001318g1 [Macrostomum lignano]